MLETLKPTLNKVTKEDLETGIDKLSSFSIKKAVEGRKTKASELLTKIFKNPFTDFLMAIADVFKKTGSIDLRDKQLFAKIADETKVTTKLEEMKTSPEATLPKEKKAA